MSLGQIPPLPFSLSPQLDLLLGLVVKLPYDQYHITGATEQELSLMSNTYPCPGTGTGSYSDAKANAYS